MLIVTPVAVKYVVNNGIQITIFIFYNTNITIFTTKFTKGVYTANSNSITTLSPRSRVIIMV